MPRLRRRRAQHGGRGHCQPVPDRGPLDCRHRRDRRQAAADPAPYPRDRHADRGGAARRAGHHRQPGLHPSGRAARSRAAPDIPIINYAPPSVWAWRPWRARAMRRYVDEVLAILPFEPAAFARLNGPPCTYVGHPLAERNRATLRPSAEEARRRLADPPVVLVLPGSRSGEIKRLAAMFGAAIGWRRSRRPLELVLPTRAAHRRAGRRGDADVAGSPAYRDRGGGKTCGVPRRARRARRIRHGHAGTGARARADGRGVSGRRVGGADCSAAWCGIDTVILANLVLGEKVVPELLQDDFRRSCIAGHWCR